MSMEQIIFHSLTDNLGKMYMDNIILDRDPINLWDVPVIENQYLPENTMLIIQDRFITFVKIDGNKLKYWDVPRERVKWKPLEPIDDDRDKRFNVLGFNAIFELRDNLRPLS